MRQPMKWVGCPECSKGKRPEDRIMVRSGEICSECYRKQLNLPPGNSYPTIGDAFYDHYLN